MRKRTIRPPTILQLEVTRNCNNACIMCHKGQVTDYDRRDLSDVALQQVKCIYPYLRHAMLFGDGEPMLHKGFWNIVQDIRQVNKKCCIDFINNGSIMTEKNILKCIDHNISHIGLSMGGATPGSHNYIRKLSDFHKVVANYTNLRDIKRRLNRMEPYVTSNICVMQSNLKELPDFIKMSDDLDFLRVECQQMFITHPMVASEEVFSDEVERIFEQCGKLARQLGIGFTHYSVDSGVYYGCDPAPSRLHLMHALFRPKAVGDTSYVGYCQYRQPWNTVYVLANGDVVPDCHWWHSGRETELNVCGKLDSQTSILDVWEGEVYESIRRRIEKNEVLPQCRGCGLAGGVVSSFRSADTDHVSPDEERVELTHTEKKPTPDTLYQISIQPVQTKLERPKPVAQSIMQKLSLLSTTATEKALFTEMTGKRPAQLDEKLLDEKLLDRFYIQWRGQDKEGSTNLFEHHKGRILKYNPSFDYEAYLTNIELAYNDRNDKKSELDCRPIYVDFEPYNLCSYKCLSCESSLKDRGHQVPDAVVEDVLDLMPTAEHVEYAKIGEIFMLPEKILPLIRRIRHLNPCIAMRTNTHGQTLSDEVIQTLVDVEFEQLSISLDSHTEEGFKTFRNGNLTEVLGNIKKVRDLKIKNNSVYPQILICSQLQSHCEPIEIVKLADEVGAVAVIFQAMVVYPSNEAKYQISSLQAPKCYGGYGNLNEKLKECREYCEAKKISLAHPLEDGLDNHQIHFGPNEVLLSLYHREDQTCPTGDPWYRFCMNGNGELSPCCFHSTFMGIRDGCLHKGIPEVLVSEFWNHETMQGLRKMLASGVYSPGCFCWKRHAFTTDPQEVNVPLDKLFTWWDRNSP